MQTKSGLSSTRPRPKLHGLSGPLMIMVIFFRTARWPLSPPKAAKRDLRAHDHERAGAFGSDQAMGPRLALRSSEGSGETT